MLGLMVLLGGEQNGFGFVRDAVVVFGWGVLRALALGAMLNVTP